MPPIAPDLTQNIVITLYLLFAHNYIAFAYFFGLVLSLALALYRPSRFTTLTTLGFGILLFSFEYDKHIIVGFREQTIKSFITTQPHYKLQRILDLVISDVLPIALYVAGWVCLYIAVFYAAKHLFHEHPRKKTTPKDHA